MSAILVIRLRSDVKTPGKVVDTMHMLNLHRVNHATIVPDVPTYRGMVHKIKDYTTYGPVTAADIVALLEKRGRVEGGGPLSDAHVAKNSEFKSIAEFAAAFAAGKTKMGAVAGLKPVLRLSPPRQGHEGIKHSFRSHGALGDRGEHIGELAMRMV